MPETPMQTCGCCLIPMPTAAHNVPPQAGRPVRWLRMQHGHAYAYACLTPRSRARTRLDLACMGYHQVRIPAARSHHAYSVPAVVKLYTLCSCACALNGKRVCARGLWKGPCVELHIMPGCACWLQPGGNVAEHTAQSRLHLYSLPLLIRSRPRSSATLHLGPSCAKLFPGCYTQHYKDTNSMSSIRTYPSHYVFFAACSPVHVHGLNPLVVWQVGAQV